MIKLLGQNSLAVVRILSPIISKYSNSDEVSIHAVNLIYVIIECRYLKSGPGNLEKDVERRFSYALSREDIENAILGGP